MLLLLILLLAFTSTTTFSLPRPTLQPVVITPDTSPEACDSAETLQTFASWTSSVGGLLSSAVRWPLFIRYKWGEKRTVGFHRDVKANETLATIPEAGIFGSYDIEDDEWARLQVNIETSYVEPVAIKGVEALRVRMSELRCVAALLRHKYLHKFKSPFKKYLDIMIPEERAGEMGHVLYWSNDAVGDTQDEALMLYVYHVQTELVKIYEAMYPGGIKAFTYSQFKWAYTYVSERHFRPENMKSVVLLIPLLDEVFSAHAATNFVENVKIIVENEDSAIQYAKLVTTANITKTDMAVASYGTFSNLYYVIKYGFVFDNNPYDAVPVVLFGFAPSDPLLIRKRKVWNNRSESAALVYPNRRPNRLMMFVRMLVATNPSLTRFEKSGNLSTYGLPTQELMVITGCMKILENTLGKFESTLSRDEDFLADFGAGMKPDKKQALRYRISKKKTLQRNLDYMAQLNEFLKFDDLANGDAFANTKTKDDMIARLSKFDKDYAHVLADAEKELFEPYATQTTELAYAENE